MYHYSCNDPEEHESDVTHIIRLYGWDRNNKSTMLRITNFPILVWVKVPDNISSKTFASFLKGFKTSPKGITEDDRSDLYFANVDKDLKPIVNKYLRCEFNTLKHMRFFCCQFDEAYSKEEREMEERPAKKKINFTIPGYNNNSFNIYVFCVENKLSSFLKLIGIKNITSCGWIKFKGKLNPYKESRREFEYNVRYNDLEELKDSINMPIIRPRYVSFDIEAYSQSNNSMPRASNPHDAPFQIGITVVDHDKSVKKYLLSVGNLVLRDNTEFINCPDEKCLYRKFAELLTEIDPEIIIGYNIIGWDFPYMIKRAKSNLSESPNMEDFSNFGCIDGIKAKVEKVAWTSSAYGKREYEFLDAKGVLIIDLLPYIKANYKLNNYRLETVCSEFLNNTNKDPIPPKAIFESYRYYLRSTQITKKEKTLDEVCSELRVNNFDEIISIGNKKLSIVGDYCVQDTHVVYVLFEKLNIWFSLVESAAANNVGIFDVVNSGQQLKMYSQLFQYCYHNGILPNSGAYIATNEHYSGAYVCDPIKGLHKNVGSFDFASLYPTIMMANNIDYTKLVKDKMIDGILVKDPNIRDEDCWIMQWEEHISCMCPKDVDRKPVKKVAGVEKVVCASYYYRWLKQDVSGKGVLPILLETLMAKRKAVKNQMEELEEIVFKLKGSLEKGCLTVEIPDIPNFDIPKIKKYIETLQPQIIILNCRQNSIKVNMNSMYGATGARKGYLPFLPAAMCVTFTGRKEINRVYDYVRNIGGIPIYGDTDSVYCKFPEFDNDTDYKKLWEHFKFHAVEASKLFKKPMKLEFENKIMIAFFIMKKKKYAAKYCNGDGVVSEKLLKRGIVLQRRDNSKLLRVTYEKLINSMFNYYNQIVSLSDRLKKNMEPIDTVHFHPKTEKTLKIRQKIAKMINKKIKLDDEEEVEEKEEKTLSLKSKIMIYRDPYINQILDELVERFNVMFSYGIGLRDFVITKSVSKDIEEYKSNTGHVYLAKKMKERGIAVPGGTRIEYVIHRNNNHVYKNNENQQEKLEDINYVLNYREIFRISHLDYMKLFVNPIDQVLEVMIGLNDFVKTQFKYRVIKQKVTTELKNKFRPVVKFVIEEEIDGEVVMRDYGSFHRVVINDFDVIGEALNIVAKDASGKTSSKMFRIKISTIHTRKIIDSVIEDYNINQIEIEVGKLKNCVFYKKINNKYHEVTPQQMYILWNVAYNSKDLFLKGLTVLREIKSGFVCGLDGNDKVVLTKVKDGIDHSSAKTITFKIFYSGNEEAKTKDRIELLTIKDCVIKNDKIVTGTKI